MKKICLALVVLLIAATASAVSADEIIVNETYLYTVRDTVTSVESHLSSTPGGEKTITDIGVRYPDTISPNALIFRPDSGLTCSNSTLYYDVTPFTMKSPNGATAATGDRQWYRDVDTGKIEYIIYRFDSWDWSEDPGRAVAKATLNYAFGTQPPYILRAAAPSVAESVFPDQIMWVVASGTPSDYMQAAATYIVNLQSGWVNILSAIRDGDSVILSAEKTIDGETSISRIVFQSHQKTTPYYAGIVDSEDVAVKVALADAPFELSSYSPVSGKWHNRTAFSEYSGSGPSPGDPGDPGDPGAPVTVYVRNSQSGEAIANSRIVIDALVDGDYYPVVNRTEPSGIFILELQPTGGGMPNPDSYRLIASADGYINQLPEINFTVDEYITSIYCSLDPIKGGPEDENKTFIDFFVRDMSANPITGATINFGGYTMITNSAGYAVLEVNKNATYTYTVSKSGYGSLTGNVVIGADPRHTINTVLAPAITPTKTTPIPTSTSISPNPTMTAPTGEPVSNWLDWFAAHFGMILGGGVEIGKIFMWLCFSVPVGVYVAKEAKAGAAGFVAGAGVVTLFFVLIGWVPIWLLVLLALIIGLLYSKVFNNSDNGGGR